ncbi:bifunctional 23S rRNA (guanine(2069)-N(7))-methyltransferase RlmK/23S rRNA (guanine(2445)-N(2))-methyltransferase RlmL [Aurantivibrio infirmus]
MPTIANKIKIFASCPKGLEILLAEELVTLGASTVQLTVAGVSAEGDQEFVYRSCLWSRLANRIFQPLSKFDCQSADDLYEGVQEIHWSEHMAATGSLWVDFSGSNDEIRHSQFGAQKVKDAIVDQFRNLAGNRPNVSKESPDLIVNVRLGKDFATLNVDLCGESLHRRGYRADSVIAPLKENLAAALIIRAGWPEMMLEGVPFIDPMCGSGTLLIEALMMAADIAPGLNREDYAFMRWMQHDQALWESLREEALARKNAGLAKSLPEIRGYDQNVLSVRATERNLENSGFWNHIKVMVKPLSEFKRPSHGDFSRGLLVTNPPYGERLGEYDSLIPLYQRLGEVFREEFVGWRAAVFTGNPELGKKMGIRSNKKYKFFNGTIASELLLFDIDEKHFVKNRNLESDSPVNQHEAKRNSGLLSPGAEMVANRIRKNQKQLQKWLRNAGTDCYRIYDADLPEYSAAIDVYGDYAHIQEYAAPKTVDEEKAAARFLEICEATKFALDISPDKISIKQRRQNKGKQQYEKNKTHPFDDMINVREGEAKLLVNLWAYLDTGIFLDHRLVRKKITELVLGKKFLNLFCYTATATVRAAMAGAQSSVSVDLSKTYIEWARKNFELNRLGAKHKLVQADCFAWLNECREPFDVILLDPPSFSNSKRMEGILDVQRDHVALIKRAMDLLNPGGVLVFSTNLTRFVLDYEQLEKFTIEDTSSLTLDRDYQRNKKIHQSFFIRHSF